MCVCARARSVCPCIWARVWLPLVQTEERNRQGPLEDGLAAMLFRPAVELLPRAREGDSFLLGDGGRAGGDPKLLVVSNGSSLFLSLDRHGCETATVRAPPPWR